MNCSLVNGLRWSLRGSAHVRAACFHSCRPALEAGKPSAEAKDALEGLGSRYLNQDGSRPATLLFQLIDANQVHLARLTLSSMVSLGAEEETNLSSGRVLQHGPPIKSALLPSEHLCYFTPRVSQALLGRDGSDTSFNPPGNVFTRRMWAGGEMTFEKDNKLKVGDRAWEKTTVEDAKWKELSGGRGEMIVVWVKKEIGNEEGTCLVDRRSWVFQPRLDVVVNNQDDRRHKGKEEDETNATTDKVVDEDLPPHSLAPSPPPTKLIQDPSRLFRYSALTFNAHAIHLSPPWASDVEGHPNIVVHGPLNLSLLLRKWGKEVGKWEMDRDGQFVIPHGGKEIRKVEYRAKKPIHSGLPYWIGFPASSTTDDRLVAVKADGSVAMEAKITTW